MQIILRNDLFTHKPASNYAQLEQANKAMGKLNALNWQYMYKKKDALIGGGDDYLVSINDWDCMIIHMQENALKSNPNAIKKFFLPISQLTVNLDKKTVTNSKGKEKALIKAESNDRLQRNRPDTIHK